MPLVDEVSRAIAEAMKARDQETLAPLRMLKTALTVKEVEKGRPLEPAEDLQVVASLVKQRRDAIEQFTGGGRPELAAREAREIEILERYLPPPASEEDIRRTVEEVVASLGASGPKDFGRVMKEVMARLAGRGADGKTVGEAVRERLG
ncbi:MAG TPA: GatB/YqeY domain-containing protein [Methylomirabilota bacterium]